MRQRMSVVVKFYHHRKAHHEPHTTRDNKTWQGDDEMITVEQSAPHCEQEKNQKLYTEHQAPDLSCLRVQTQGKPGTDVIQLPGLGGLGTTVT